MLKVLMLRKKIDDAKKALAKVMEDADALVTREAELETCIAEAETDEEKQTVSEAIDGFEKDKETNEAEKAQLEKDISDMEAELRELESKQEAPIENAPAIEEKTEERKDSKVMSNRAKFFNALSMTERTAMFEREDVKSFLETIRDAIAHKRAITNAGLLIPEVFIGLLRENIINYSKLYRHANVVFVGGSAREVVQGTIPEAVWTEMCANLNELALGFNDVTVDGYMVGGFIPVCNATLEDADIDLASTILDALAQAIGYALDKAILYGTGTKMPLGVVARLAQTEAPTGYPATARPWADLHTSNIISITSANSTGIKLFQGIAGASGSAKGKYARGSKTWVMNETTYTKLIVEAMAVNANGAIVSGVNGTMPVIGGDIEVLDFVPDNVIIGGYFELYLLAERAGTKLEQSEHVRFLNSQTVFKGTARYDGQPAIAEAFVAIGISGVTPNATMSFAQDTAN